MSRRSFTLRIILTFLIAVTYCVGTLAPQTVLALSKEQKKVFDAGVYKFNVAADSFGCGSGDGALVGSDNAEKVWNFFIGKGLTPVATAGIMGNFHEETLAAPFDPALKQNNATHAIPDNGDGTTGFGIAQWTYPTRQALLFAKIRQAGLQEYYGEGWGNPEDNREMPEEDVDELLTVELNFAWEGDSTKIKDLMRVLNAATSVGGDGGSAVVFHRTYEGSGDSAAQIRERVTAAENYLDEYEDTAGGGDSTSCAGQLGGVSTMEDAIPWAMRFVEDTKTAYNPGGHSLNEQQAGPNRINLYVTNDGVVGNGGGCWGATYCGQCTALSGWFVTKMTEYTYGNGNGNEVVSNLRARGVSTGSEPKPFSVFSYDTGSVGHTGVVLGVFEGGVVITIENNLSSNTLAVLKYNIKQEHPDVRFAYVGDKLKVDGLDPNE